MEYSPSLDPTIFQQKNLPKLEAWFDGSQPELSLITPGLYLGTQRAAGYLFPFERGDKQKMSEALERLRSLKITHIVCACGEGEEWRVFEKEGIKYICLKLQDGDGIEETSELFGSFLDKSVPFLDEALGSGNSALVHCASGAHRSASIVCGYLMIKRCQKLDDIYPLVFEGRSLAFPVYWKYLIETVERRIYGK